MTATPPREITTAEVEAALTAVLARPEFQVVEPGPLARMLTWVGDQVRALLASLFGRLPLPDFGGSWFSWAIRGALALAAALLVIHLVRVLAREGAPARAGRGRRVETAPPEARDWSAEAERAAGAGRFHEAVLALYQALLARLRERGLIRLDPAKTPGDYRRELRPHPTTAGAMDRFLALFEPAAFGGRDPDRDVYDRLRARAGEAADG